MIERSWKRPCPRCRVERHDRCAGPDDCGCLDPAHERTGEQLAEMGFYQVADEQGDGDGGGVYQIDPDAETVIIEMSTRQYAQLVEAAQAQERDPGVVLRRALEHYHHCERAGCRHEHDERAGGAVEASGEQDEDPAPDPAPAPLEADPAMMFDRPSFGG